MFEVFQREVFEFALELVEPQFVGQGGVEVGCFGGGAAHGFLVRVVLDMPHEVDTAGYDEQHDAHVFGERDEKVTEIVCLDAGRFVIELADAAEAMKDARDAGREGAAERVGIGFGGQSGLDEAGRERIAAQPDLLGGQNGCLYGREHGVEAECVAFQRPALCGLHEAVADFPVAVVGEEVGIEAVQGAEEREKLAAFFWREKEFFSVHRPNVLDKSTFFLRISQHR
mgnify:CR=1 FL=1